MKKYLLFAIFAFFSGKGFASNELDIPSNTTQNQCFPYQREVFQLYMTSNIDSDTPSLAQLYKDAKDRKIHLDALVEHIRENKFNKEKNKDIFRLSNHSKDQLEQSGMTSLPEDLHMIVSFQADFLPEKDLTEYFLQALAGFAQNSPTKEQIQELYKQTVYASRMNLESLKNAIFAHLSIRYPNKYERVQRNGKIVQQEYMIPWIFETQEDKFYADFRMKHPESIAGVSGLDTVSVTKMARTLSHPPVDLTNPGIIYELNSLLFYLNMERALLNVCPDLVFSPADYAFGKDVSLQSKAFALSRISDFHRQGMLHQLSSSETPDQKKIQFCLRQKERLLETILKNSAEEPIEFFLKKLFPVAPKEAVTLENPMRAKTPKKNNKKGSKKGTPKNKKNRNTQNIHANKGDQNTQTSPAHTNILNILAQEEDYEEEEFLPARPDELQEVKFLIESAETQKPTYASMVTSTAEQPTLPLISPYKTKLHLDDYTYKRCISSAPSGSYLFLGEAFDMPGMFFDVNTLREIKKLTNHDPEHPHLQNMASYRLRFHFSHENGTLDTMDFMAPYQYLSGGRRLDADYRQQNNIKMAFHDYLTPSQAKTYLQKGKDENREFLLNTLSAQVNECVTQGPWHHNCADSEALMVIDLQKEMPTMLQKLAPSTGEKITLLGAVLGASSYHDLCWRCRNLFQGWQWGLSDTITHWKDAYHLPITLSPDFSTIVFGFGEVAPQSHDFYPPKQHKGITSLGTSDIDARRRHKLKIVSLKRETL